MVFSLISVQALIILGQICIVLYKKANIIIHFTLHEFGFFVPGCIVLGWTIDGNTETVSATERVGGVDQ